jgi:hypothetical protein
VQSDFFRGCRSRRRRAIKQDLLGILQHVDSVNVNKSPALRGMVS